MRSAISPWAGSTRTRIRWPYNALVSSTWKLARDTKGPYSVANGSYYVLHIYHERKTVITP